MKNNLGRSFLILLFALAILLQLGPVDQAAGQGRTAKKSRPALVTSIKGETSGSIDRIVLKTDRPIEPSIEFPASDRIILTFPNSILLDNVGPASLSGKYIKKYWAAQFSKRPLVFRLVADLKKKIRPTFELEPNKGRLVMIFGKEAPVTTISTPVAPVTATTLAGATNTADTKTPANSAAPTATTPTSATAPAQTAGPATNPPPTSTEPAKTTSAPILEIQISKPAPPAAKPPIIYRDEEISAAKVIAGKPTEIITDTGRENPAKPMPEGAKPRLIRLAYERTGNIYSIHLTTTSPCADIKADELKDPARLVIDLKGLVFDLPDKELPVRDDIIRIIRAAQFDPDNCRITLEMTEDNTSYMVTADETNKEIYIFFIPQITKISDSATAQEETIKIDLNRQTIFEIKKLNNPPRLLIDFPQTVFRANNLIKPMNGPVQQIRGSQWQSYPPISRVVMDLQADLPFSAALSDDRNSLWLKFPIPKAFSRVEEISSPARAFRNKIIVINPGHGGNDPGAPTYDREHPEKYYTLLSALKISQALSSAGATVLLTREDDSDNTLEHDVRFARDNNASILIDFHYNSSYSSKTIGTEIYYYKPEDYPLASAVHATMINALGLEDKGLRKAKFYTLRHSTMPAVLVEPAHVSNPEELRLIKEDAFQNKIVEAVVEGLDDYFKDNP